MLNRRPLAILISACLLQACVTPTARQATVVQPVFEVRHSDNKDAATYARLGKYHQDRGNLDRARAAYIQSISIDGRQITARTALAAIDSQQGRLDEAKSMLQDVVADFPSAAHPYNNLGYVYYLQGNFDLAVKTLQKSVALDGGNDRARNNLKMAQAAAASQGELATILRKLPETPVIGKDAPQAPVAKVPVAKVAAATVTVPVVASVVVPIAAPVAAPLATPAPAQSRMEVVQITPNVYELKARTPLVAVTPVPAVIPNVIAVTPVVTAPLVKAPVVTAPVAAVPAVAAPVVGSPATVKPIAPAQAIVLPKPALPALAAPPASALRTARLEIANGIGVKGIARRVSDLLGKQGITTNVLSDQRPFGQQVTEIQYRAGFEKQAQSLKLAMRGQSIVVRPASMNLATDVRVIVGRDLAARMASMETTSDVRALAMNSTRN